MSNGEQRGTSRSGFLKQAAGATMAVAGAGVGAGVVASGAAASVQTAADQRTYTAGRFLLQLDGVNCGFFVGLDGGDPDFDVVLDAVGSDSIQRKHVANIKHYADFTMQVGSNMGQPMYDWITDSMTQGAHVTKNGSFSSADFNYREVRHETISEAHITSVTIPALDAASTTPVYMAVSVSPLAIITSPPSGQPVDGAKQKAWLPSNFVFECDGVDTSRVATIDSFTWKCTVADDGSQVLDVSNIAVTFPRASLPSWQQWFDNQGANGVSDERAGVLSMVGAKGGGVAKATFSNLSIIRLRPDPAKPALRMKAEMYCESMSYDLIISRKV